MRRVAISDLTDYTFPDLLDLALLDLTLFMLIFKMKYPFKISLYFCSLRNCRLPCVVRLRLLSIFSFSHFLNSPTKRLH